jgi:hypothetical protein
LGDDKEGEYVTVSRTVRISVHIKFMLQRVKVFVAGLTYDVS